MSYLMQLGDNQALSSILAQTKISYIDFDVALGSDANTIEMSAAPHPSTSRLQHHHWTQREHCYSL